MSLLSTSKSPFIKSLLGKDALIFNASHTMNGRRHTVLAKFKVKLTSIEVLCDKINYLLFLTT